MVRGLLALVILFSFSMSFAALKVKNKTSAAINFSMLYNIDGVDQSVRSMDVARFMEQYLIQDSPAFQVAESFTEEITLTEALVSLSKERELFKPLTPKEIEKVKKFVEMNNATAYQVSMVTMSPPGMRGKTNYFLFVSQTKTLVLVVEQLLYNE